MIIVSELTIGPDDAMIGDSVWLMMWIVACPSMCYARLQNGSMFNHSSADLSRQSIGQY
jgi:hypothetical protein